MGSPVGALPALVLLSDKDTDAPKLPAVATVSKDDQWDRGAYAIGEAAAREGRLWVDRAYFTGRPDLQWVIQKCRRVTEAGGFFQYGNELNLEMEGWNGPPISYAASFALAQMQYPEGNWVYMPPSPGVPGWQEWIPKGADFPLAVHAYGHFAGMCEVVDWYLRNTSGDLYITECNPGAGNRFRLNAWATDHLAPFLNWCRQHPRIKMVAYFSWTWNESKNLPSSTDAKGTKVVEVLQAAANGVVITPPPQQVTTPVSQYTIGPGFQDLVNTYPRMVGAPTSDERWHNAGRPDEVSLMTTDRGVAVWIRNENRRVFVPKGVEAVWDDTNGGPLRRRT